MAGLHDVTNENGSQPASDSHPDATDIVRITTWVLEALQRDESVDPAALMFLLGQYCEAPRADVAAALERALAVALAGQPGLSATGDRAAWLVLFSEAVSMSDDSRLRQAVDALAAAMKAEWPALVDVDEAARSVEACLVAANVLGSRELAADAVGELERIVGAAYRPGEGVAHQIASPGRGRGGLGDAVHAASALLTAYGATARLAYPMLAEEVMQHALRTSWHGPDGGLVDGSIAADRARSFVLNCDAARVLCRLAALHRDAEYRTAAVVAADRGYDADAARTLASQAPIARERGAGAAPYGLALAEWLNLQRARSS